MDRRTAVQRSAGTDDGPGAVIVATADSAWRREIGRWIREAAGIEAVWAGSSAELLEHSGLRRARLVVIDEALPGSGGLVTGAMVRQIHPSVRLILAVASRRSSMLEDAAEIGFSMLMERREGRVVLGGLER